MVFGGSGLGPEKVVEQPKPVRRALSVQDGQELASLSVGVRMSCG